MNRREKKRIELAQSAKNCVTKKEVRVGKANIKSHSNMGTGHLWSSFNAVHFSFLPIPDPESQPSHRLPLLTWTKVPTGFVSPVHKLR